MQLSWSCLLYGQPRIIWSVNDQWKYLPEGADFAQKPAMDDTGWKMVHIPHTWNSKDPFDDDETSRRGISWYRKKISLDHTFKNKRLFIHFEGVGQVADVYINGVFAGQHKGGYTGFTFDITNLVQLGDVPTENLIAVQVNNAHDEFLPPLSVGYASYGGIYRDVWLIATNDLHFDLVDHGARGVFITTPQVSKAAAEVRVRAKVVNDAPTARSFEIVHTLYDQNNVEIQTISAENILQPGTSADMTLDFGKVQKPGLWSPDNPCLYQVKSVLRMDGRTIDEQVNTIGFRWFAFDADKGFLLNGEKLILKGTNRHQDVKDKGDALMSGDHYRDLKLIKDMGCNFLRLAHYPQAREVLDLADKMGLIVWEEVPVVNYINTAPAFLENAKQMIREMVRQHYNHPAILVWGSMNEVLLWSNKAERVQVHTDTLYLKKVREYTTVLDALLRAEDPFRVTAIAMHISDDYEKYGLSTIPQLMGFNIYDGWYSGEAEAFKSTIDAIHRSHPKHPVFISEYGAEADNRVNSEKPTRLDFTGQYQRYYHEVYLRQINKMPYLAGTAIWNQFDFSQPNVGGVSNNMNQKGVVTWDRKPKDSYYLYKANWTDKPMVYIASRDWQIRAGTRHQPSTIEVYSNLEEITLTVNGVSYGSQKPDDVRKCVWSVVLSEGDNRITASSNTGEADHLNISYKVYGEVFKEEKNFREIAVNVGAATQYTDGTEHVWIEDRPYKTGSFGHVGGMPGTLSIKTVKKNTYDTPLFYSYLADLEAYKFDVGDGTYELEMGFIEPERVEDDGRIFDVLVNGNRVIAGLNLMRDHGFAVAVNKKFIVNATGGKGIQVAFSAQRGQAVLSGIRIKKVN